MDKNRIYFNQSTKPTLGVEVELYTVLKDTLNLCSGTPLPILDSWIINENKWRATHYGLDAEIIIDECENHQALRSNIIEIIDKLIPVAEELGCKDELVKLGDLAENNQAPYQRQTLHFQRNNDYTDIVKNSIIEFEKGIAIEC